MRSYVFEQLTSTLKVLTSLYKKSEVDVFYSHRIEGQALPSRLTISWPREECKHFLKDFQKVFSPCAGFGPASRFRLPGFKPGAVPIEPARHALTTGFEPVRRSPGYSPLSKRVPYQLGLHELALSEGVEPSRRFRRLPLSGRMQYRSAKTARSLLGDLNPAFPA